MGQYVVGGSASNGTGGHHDYISSGHPLSSSHYFNSTSAQVARGSGNLYSRSSLSAYRNGLSYSSARHEAVSPNVQSYVGSSDSRYMGSLSAGGLHSNYRNVRSSLALERVQPISGLVDTRQRIGTEVCSIVFSSTPSMLTFMSWFSHFSVLLLKLNEDFVAVTLATPLHM